MPENPSDRDNSVISIIEQQNTLGLSELSERDKPWDEHRATSDKVAG